MAGNDTLTLLQTKIWSARLPLEIRIAPAECRVYNQVDPYLIACPRLTYLPTLLPRLLAFFSPYLIADSASVVAESGYLVHESIPLKWQLPVGLLYDLHVLSTQHIDPDEGPLLDGPFRLTVHFAPSTNVSNVELLPSSGRALNDAFINSVKEADFLRSGTAKPIMSLSAADSKALWTATEGNDLMAYAKIHSSLLPPVGQLRHIPLRIYIPASREDDPARARIKVVQGQFGTYVVPSTPSTASQLRGTSGTRAQAQTLGTALHSLVPSLFPSRRAPLLARPLLHGVQIPMAANLEELARKCCYADGWVNVVIAMGS